MLLPPEGKCIIKGRAVEALFAYIQFHANVHDLMIGLESLQERRTASNIEEDNVAYLEDVSKHGFLS